MIFFIFAVLLSYNECNGVIYHLNDTEYYRMPPLSILDMYDECLHQPGSLYCLARFDLFADSQNDLITVIEEYSAYTKKHYNHSYMDRGICIMKTCRKYIDHHNLSKTEDLATLIEICVNASVWNDYGIQAKLSNIYNCDRYNEEIEIDYADWAVAGLISILLILNISGSVYDAFYYDNDSDSKKLISTGQKILFSFSILRNWESLVKESTAPKNKELKRLNSTKVLATLCVIAAHVFIMNSTRYSDNPLDLVKAYETIHYQLIITALMIVEIFFLISGLLAVYNLELQCESLQINWKLIPKILFMRWWRLSTAYLVVLGLTATWLRHVGSGPLWKYSVVNSVVADCRKSWWLHISYANNYVGRSLCGVHTWYVAADTQLFTFGVVVYFLMRNRRKKIVFPSLLILGMVAPAIHVWLNDYDAIMLLEPEFMHGLISDHFTYLHIPGHNNLPSYIIGMVIGYFIYNSEYCKKYCEVLPDKLSNLYIWCFPIVMWRYFLTGRIFYEEYGTTSLVVKLVYAATHRFIIGCLIGLYVLLLLTKLNERSRKFFEWRGWLVPSKLSFGVYLLHMYLIHILIGHNYQLAHVSLLNAITLYFAVTTMSFVMAIPLYLLVEAPSRRLLRILMNGDTEKFLAKKST